MRRNYEVRTADSVRHKSVILGLTAAVLILISIPLALSQSSTVGWHSIPSGVTTNFNSVVAINETDAWVVGDAGTILYTSDSGQTWVTENSGVSSDLLDITFNQVPFVVGTSGTILARIDGVWTDISILGGPDLNAVSVTNFTQLGNAVIYVAGNGGKIYKGDGLAFNETATGETTDINGMSFYDHLNGLAVGDNGVILGTTDGAVTWEVRDTPSNVSSTNFNDVFFVSNIRAYIVGDDGVFLRSAFQNDVGIGYQWKEWSTGLNVNLHGVDASSVNKVWVIGDLGTVALTKDGGATFTSQKLDVNTTSRFNEISMVNSDIGFLVGDSSEIFFTDTGGSTINDKPTALTFNSFFEYANFASPRLLDGLIATVKIVVFSIFFGFTLGVTLAMFKTSRLLFPIPYGFTMGDDNIRYVKYYAFNPLKIFANIYTNLFRNTPLLVQFLFIHFGLFQAGVDLTRIFFTPDRAFLSAIVALSLNSGAYQAEIIRSGIQAIPVGQMEAGRSMGLSYIQTMRYIIMPQAIRIVIPPLGNEVVNLVLNSSLAFTIGYTELTRQGNLLIAITFKTFWTWGLVLVYYFIVTFSLSNVMRYIEKKTKIPGLGVGGEI